MLFNNRGQLSRSELEMLEALAEQQQVQAVASAYGGVQLVPTPDGCYAQPFEATAATPVTPFNLEVIELDGSPQLFNINKLVIDGAAVSSLGTGNALIAVPPVPPPFSGASVTRPANQNLSNGTSLVAFNTTEFDSDSYVSGSTFIAPTDGYYMVGGWVLLFPTGLTGTGFATLGISKNSLTTVVATSGVIVTSGDGVILSASGLVQLSVGDTISLLVGITFSAGSGFASGGSIRMWIHKVK
jgi:hypothetical protein